MRIYTAFIIDGCIKTPISTPQKILTNAIWEIEGKTANTQEKKDKFQEQGVYFEVGYTDITLDEHARTNLEWIAGKCTETLITFIHSGYSKNDNQAVWKWVRQ